MVRAASRPGHSLPELIVAVAFLGASLGAVGATAAAAAGRTRDAVLKQEAVRQTGTILDSLLAAPQLENGERQLTGVAIHWKVLESVATPRVEVVATGPRGRELVRIEARWFPAEKPLPFEDGPGS